MPGPRPEPRLTGWVHLDEFRSTLNIYGSGTVYDEEAYAKKIHPDKKALRVTIIVHTPRVTRRKKRKLTGAAAQAVMAKRDRR